MSAKFLAVRRSEHPIRIARIISDENTKISNWKINITFFKHFAFSNFKHFARSGRLSASSLSLIAVETVGGYTRARVYACRAAPHVCSNVSTRWSYRPSAERTSQPSCQPVIAHGLELPTRLLISQISGRDVAARPAGRALLLIAFADVSQSFFATELDTDVPEAHSR